VTLARDLAAADAYVPDGLTTREALELAALDAAVFRGASEKTLARKLSIVSKDGSIRPGTGRDMLRGLAKIQGLEHVVEEEGRPATVVCLDCAEVVSVGKMGHVPKRCKPCKKKEVAARMKAYREANAEKIAARDKARYDANPEKAAAYGKARYDANPEKHAAQQKAYREANPDKVAARAKAYYDANPEKVAAYGKAYAKANKGKVAARKKAYREANAEQVAAYGKAWRAKKEAEAAESAAAKPKARATRE